MLMTIYTTMLFSSGMPILYLSTFLQFMTVYWADKLYFLKICKTPKFYNDEMQELVRDILYLTPFIHAIFAIYVYGNSTIFIDSNITNALEDHSSLGAYLD